ncbi:hypothetical protein AB0L49_37345 [Streptomyces antimycoticus]
MPLQLPRARPAWTVNADVTLQFVRQGQLVAADKGFLNATKTLQNADVH